MEDSCKIIFAAFSKFENCTPGRLRAAGTDVPAKKDFLLHNGGNSPLTDMSYCVNGFEVCLHVLAKRRANVKACVPTKGVQLARFEMAADRTTRRLPCVCSLSLGRSRPVKPGGMF